MARRVLVGDLVRAAGLGEPRVPQAEQEPEGRQGRDEQPAVSGSTSGRVRTQAKALVHPAIDTTDIGAKSASAAAASRRSGRAATSRSTTAPVPARPWSAPIANAWRGVRPW